MSKTIREYIANIQVENSNLQHIAETGKINGSLLLSIEKAMQDYAQSQNQELIETINELTPMAEDGYKLHKSNGSHQDFLEDDRDILKKAKELLTKYNHLNQM